MKTEQEIRDLFTEMGIELLNETAFFRVATSSVRYRVRLSHRYAFRHALSEKFLLMYDWEQRW